MCDLYGAFEGSISFYFMAITCFLSHGADGVMKDPIVFVMQG